MKAILRSIRIRMRSTIYLRAYPFIAFAKITEIFKFSFSITFQVLKIKFTNFKVIIYITLKFVIICMSRDDNPLSL